MAKTLIPNQKKCGDCLPVRARTQTGPPTVIPPRSYTPSRPSCIECCEKHLGAAYVLLTELNDLPNWQAGLPDPPSPVGSGMAGSEATRRQGFSRRLRAIDHLFEAEDESQQ